MFCSGERGGEDEELSNSSLSTGCGKLVPLVRPSLQSLSQEMAMGLVLPGGGRTGVDHRIGLGRSSGSAANEEGEEITETAERRWPMLTKSPRRKMRVAFTCNVCGERTTRAINPHAYTDGTVFVQVLCNIQLYQHFSEGK
ncbi:hypothetical protein O6H91_Y125800 [Diphasiastrum complanatum]|nr:hypothetical protein O6H91_Y125800 [Diphasiastrum complanatum]